MDSSNLEKFVDNCALLTDVDPSGQYLLGVVYIWRKDWNLRGVHLRQEMHLVASRRSNVTMRPLLAMASRSCMQLLPAGKSRFTVSLGADGKTHRDAAGRVESSLSLFLCITVVTPTIFPETFPPSSMRVPAVTPTFIF